MGGWVGEWMDGSVMMQMGLRVLGIPSLIKFFQTVIKLWLMRIINVRYP